MNVTLYYKYLMHDIDQWTYRLAKVRIQDGMAADEAESNDKRSTDLSFYRRKIEDGVAHLRAHFSEELSNSTDDATDILDTAKASWLFTFKADSSITVDSTAMAELMHRFVVFHVIRDWTAVYAPDAASTAQSLLTEAEDALDENAYSLDLPTKHRRPDYPKDENEIKFA